MERQPYNRVLRNNPETCHPCITFIEKIYNCEFVSFVLMLYVPVNNFSVMFGLFPVFLCCSSNKQRIKCLAAMPPVSL